MREAVVSAADAIVNDHRKRARTIIENGSTAVGSGAEVVIGWLPRSSDSLFHLSGEPSDVVALTQVLNEHSRLVGAVVDFSPSEWATLTPGFGAGETRGELTLHHEVEHVAGIGDQMRWPGDLSFEQLIARTAASFGQGDLAGLRALGCRA